MTKDKWFYLANTGILIQEHINQWLSKGNSIDEQDNGGQTALMRACYYGKYEIAQLLIEKGADLNQQDEDGWTALIWACSRGRYEVANLLINNGADMNLQNIWDDTALIEACNKGHYEIAKLLLENGGNPYLLNNRNKSAYDYSDDKVKQLILSHHPYFLHKSVKQYINKKNNNILDIKKLNLPLIKLI